MSHINNDLHNENIAELEIDIADKHKEIEDTHRYMKKLVADKIKNYEELEKLIFRLKALKERD